MPNGADRNFVRFVRCIELFRTQFNKWPSRVRLDPSFIKELQEVISEEAYGRLREKIEIIPDNSNPYDGLYVAEDDEGNILDSIRPKYTTKGVNAMEWLGIEWPDY